MALPVTFWSLNNSLLFLLDWLLLLLSWWNRITDHAVAPKGLAWFLSNRQFLLANTSIPNNYSCPFAAASVGLHIPVKTQPVQHPCGTLHWCCGSCANNNQRSLSLVLNQALDPVLEKHRKLVDNWRKKKKKLYTSRITQNRKNVSICR